MASNQFLCPSCQTLLKLPEPVPSGTKIKCPKCTHVFAAPPEAEAIALAPVEPVLPRAPVPPPPPPPPIYEDYPQDTTQPYYRGQDPLAGLSNRYSINIGDWFSHGTAHYSAAFGPMIGYGLLLGVINLAGFIPVVGLLKALFLDCALNAGFAIVVLKQLQGQPWTFGDFFGGFRFYGSLLGNFWLWAAGLLCAALPILLIVGASVAVGKPIVIVPAVLMGGVYLCAVIYVALRAFLFSTYLIVDRGCGPIEAIRGSWTLTEGHFWGLLGTWILVLLIGASGMFLCFIGALFTAPLYWLIMASGFLLITGARPLSQPAAPQAPPYGYDQSYQAQHPPVR
jgi:hypothetical protein